MRPIRRAMDAILSKEGPKRSNHINAGLLEGPRCEDIKQEVDIDINDDMESWATNDSMGSGLSDEPAPSIILKPATLIKPKPKEMENLNQTQPKAISTILPSITIPNQNSIKPGTMPSMSLPLLILNSLQPQQAAQDKKNSSNVQSNPINEKSCNDINITLKEILEIQKKNLDIKKQKLELQKQKLEFDRVVGSQLLTLVPMIGGLLQRLTYSEPNDDEYTSGKGKKRPKMEEIDIFKDSKILRTVLEQGIKKYMLGEEGEEGEEETYTDNEEESFPQDENSNAST